MKRFPISYFLVFITTTNFHYNCARVFEEKILMSIEEVHGDGGAKLKLHPLTTMSQQEKELLCSAAKEHALLSDNPSETKLYTRLFRLKPDNGKEGTLEEITSSAVDETNSSFSESYIDRVNKYAQLPKNRSVNEKEGTGVETPSSRSIEEKTSLLHNDDTEAQINAQFSSMSLNGVGVEPYLVSDIKEISADNWLPNEMNWENKKIGIATDGRSSAAVEETTNTSLSNGYTRTDTATDLPIETSIPEGEIEDFMEDYEEDVALVCPTIPVVHLSLGELTDEVKIMFSYVFSVEAIHSATTVPDHEVDDEQRRNHLLAFEQKQLHALCNITRKCVPIEDIVFKRHEISKPQILEIAYPPQFEKPNRRDVVITCPLNPYTTYIRYQPPNEMKIMVTDTALFELLQKYGLNAELLISEIRNKSIKKPIDGNANGVLTK